MSQAPETVPFDGEGNCDFVALFSFHVPVLMRLVSIKPDFWLHCSCYRYEPKKQRDEFHPFCD